MLTSDCFTNVNSSKYFYWQAAHCPVYLQEEAVPLNVWLQCVSFTSSYKHVAFGFYGFEFFGVCVTTTS